MALVNAHTGGSKAFVNPRVQFPSQDSRGSDLLKERVSYSQMAAEREQAIHGMEMKQARLFEMERLEDEARRMRRVHQERQLFQGQERSMQALEQDRLRHLNLEESKIRLRERQARDRQRLVSHRRSQAELQWRADEERRRRLMIEEEAFRQRASSYGGHRPRHHSYVPPQGTPRQLPPPSPHYAYRESPRHHALPPPRSPSYSVAALDIPHYGHARHLSVPGGPPSYAHPAPLFTPRARRLSDPAYRHL